MDTPPLKITGDGTVEGTRLYLDGHDISSCVQAVEWAHTHDSHPTARVTIMATAVDVHAADPLWVGLDRAPPHVLRDELDRRE